ncbi:hypothetical protein V8F33_007432 [Rhypophila sp. PSN 637]
MTTPQSHSPHLPTSRQLLTSLFDAISGIPLEKSTSRRPEDGGSTDDKKINTSDDATHDINEAKEELNKRRRKLLLPLSTSSSRKGKVEARGIKTEPAGNILKQVPLSHRHLIITLHVLFPGLVLPALDLLDRGLVGRVILGKGSSSTIPIKREQQKREAIKKEEDKQRGTKETTNSKKKVDQSPPKFYLVRSAQEKPTSRRRNRGQQRRRQHQRYESGDDDQEEDYHERADMSGGNNLFPGGPRAYIVRLEAWNCTCAAFAFAASFPIHPRTTSSEAGQTEKKPQQQDGNEQDDDDDNRRDTTGQERETTGHGAGIDQDSAEDEGERMDMDPPPAELDSDTIMKNEQPLEEAGNGQDTRDTSGWTFGGLTLEQRGGDCPPLCKHLLACLLAERWNDALGQYVVERQVSKQEMAGIVAEI